MDIWHPDTVKQRSEALARVLKKHADEEEAERLKALPKAKKK